MPFTVTNRGLNQITQTAFTAATDLRVLVFKTTTPTVANIRDYNSVADLLAATTEATASGYSRTALTGLTVTENDTPDTVTITATAPVWTSVAVGETWLGVAYYIEAATDALRQLIAVDVPAASVVTNGGNITGPTLLITITGS